MAFVAVANADSASASSLACDKPTGTVDNDYMFAVVKRNDSTAPTGVPTDWDLLASNIVGGGSSLWLYGRLASSEGASYTWTWASAGRTGITIATYRGGFDTTDVVDAISNTAYTTSNTTVRAASASAAAANSQIIFIGCVHNGSSVTFTAPSAPSAFAEDSDFYDSGSRFARTFASMTWSGSGATGDIDSTISATLTDKHAFAVIMNPAAAASTVVNPLSGVGGGAAQPLAV